jgi:hypothetical protein
MSDTLLTDLQIDVADRLAADSVLGTINVVTERTGDIAAEINRSLGVLTAVGATRGICLVALQISASPESLEAPGPLLNLSLRVRVLENPPLNTSGLLALTVARRVLRVLHHYQPAGLTSVLLADSPCITPVADPIAPVSYEVAFEARESEYETQGKVLDPTISASSGTAPSTITLTCGTAGAAIYYTTNGRLPRSGGAGSALYSAPFVVASPATVRAAAYATGLIASNTSSKIIA